MSEKPGNFTIGNGEAISSRHRTGRAEPLAPVPAAIPAPVRSPGARPRVAALDIVRGFALCGVLLVNVQPIADSGTPVLNGSSSTAAAWMGMFVHQRFLPIFSLLFGIGFSLLLRSVRDHSARPRLVLARRLLALFAIGLVHHVLLWPGDILTVYAAAGLVVLLPSSWLPRWLVGALGVLVTVAALALGGGTFVLVPGLFLVGSALARFGVVDRMERSIVVPAALGLGCGVAAVPTLWLQQMVGDDRAASTWTAVSGVVMGAGYLCVLVVLLRTPLRRLLRTLFAGLGRMALTNYLTATPMVLLIGWLAGPADRWSMSTVAVVAGGVLAVQWGASTLWLARYRHGPLEWLWRWATWMRRPAARRSLSDE